MTRIGEPLTPSRCPRCNVSAPNITMAARPQHTVVPRNGQPPRHIAVYVCYTCGGGVLVEGEHGDLNTNAVIGNVIPGPRDAHVDLPQAARTYLDQAYQTLVAPDAAAVMAGSAVDAMLKALGYERGSVYERIDQARAAHLLTEGMAKWAHSVRLGANRPRHADKDAPHVSLEEAKQSVDFAEALGNFLFVLTARIDRGIAEAGVEA